MSDLLLLIGKGKTKKWLVGKGVCALQSGDAKQPFSWLEGPHVFFRVEKTSAS